MAEMVPKDVIDKFFDDMALSDVDRVKNTLRLYPAIVKAPHFDDLPFQYAKQRLDLSKRRYQASETSVRKKAFESKKDIFNCVFDATVLYAIEHQDIALLQYLKDHNASPILTLSNGIAPLSYAREHGKEEVVAWIKNIFKQSRESLKARGPDVFKGIGKTLSMFAKLEQERASALSECERSHASAIQAHVESTKPEPVEPASLARSSLSFHHSARDAEALEQERMAREIEHIDAVIQEYADYFKKAEAIVAAAAAPGSK